MCMLRVVGIGGWLVLLCQVTFQRKCPRAVVALDASVAAPHQHHNYTMP